MAGGIDKDDAAFGRFMERLLAPARLEGSSPGSGPDFDPEEARIEELARVLRTLERSERQRRRRRAGHLKPAPAAPGSPPAPNNTAPPGAAGR